MKRIVIAAIVVSVLASVLFVLAVLFGEQIGDVRTNDKDPEDLNGSVFNVQQFCTAPERTNIDFSILNDVRSILRSYSVFQDKAQDPELLLNGALETMFASLSVQRSQIPSWARDIIAAELASNPRTPDFSVLNDVYNELIKDPNYSDLQDPFYLEELVKTSILGVIDALGDPFANYVSADALRAGATSTQGRYRGIGISVSINGQGEISVRSVIQGGSARRAGLKADDVILRVNGMLTEKCGVMQFILNFKSLQGDTRQLTIARATQESTQRDILDIKVEMEQIKQSHLSTYPSIDLPDGRGSTLSDIPYRCGESLGIGLPCPFVDEDGNGIADVLYIRIHQFTDQMEKDLEYFLGNIDLSMFKGVVVDVRSNPGGLVSATVNAVDFFLPTDDYIFIQKSASGFIMRSRSNQVTYLDADVPLVILTDQDSYSGAELFASALRDNGRAVLISRDERTGGKGTVNQYYNLRRGDYGALYVSIFLWLTPSGEMIEKQDLDNDGIYETGGLSPDIYVPWSDEDFTKNNRDVNYDPTLQAALDYIEKNAK